MYIISLKKSLDSDAFCSNLLEARQSTPFLYASSEAAVPQREAYRYFADQSLRGRNMMWKGWLLMLQEHFEWLRVDNLISLILTCQILSDLVRSCQSCQTCLHDGRHSAGPEIRYNSCNVDSRRSVRRCPCQMPLPIHLQVFTTKPPHCFSQYLAKPRRYCHEFGQKMLNYLEKQV